MLPHLKIKTTNKTNIFTQLMFFPLNLIHYNIKTNSTKLVRLNVNLLCRAFVIRREQNMNNMLSPFNHYTLRFTKN